MSHARRHLLAHLCVIGILLGALVLFRFPPEHSTFYPRCIFYSSLHLYCPGCGGTRALAALLHGHLSEAFHWNAMLLLMLPFFAVFLMQCYLRAVRSQPFAWPTVPALWLKLCVLLVACFTIARNIHWQ